MMSGAILEPDLLIWCAARRSVIPRMVCWASSPVLTLMYIVKSQDHYTVSGLRILERSTPSHTTSHDRELTVKPPI